MREYVEGPAQYGRHCKLISAAFDDQFVMTFKTISLRQYYNTNTSLKKYKFLFYNP